MRKITMWMQGFVALGLLCGAIGCNSIYAKAPLANTISVNAVAAADVADGKATAEQAKAFLTSTTGGLALDAYYKTSTVNWFAYAFGDKQLYCSTAQVYLDLRENALNAVQNAKRNYSDALAQRAAVAEAKAVISIDKLQKGVK